MWQRVQTLYLAAATILVGLLFFVNKAIIPGAGGETPVQEFRYILYTPYVILIAIAAFLDFLALTTYKHRVFQMRTAVLASLITLALQVWIGVDFFLNNGSGGMVFRVSAVFPLLAVICDLMAARAIYSDILIVESVSRLRSSKTRR